MVTIDHGICFLLCDVVYILKSKRTFGLKGTPSLKLKQLVRKIYLKRGCITKCNIKQRDLLYCLKTCKNVL